MPTPRRIRRILPEDKQYADAVNRAREALRTSGGIERESMLPSRRSTESAQRPAGGPAPERIDRAADELIEGQQEAFAESPEGIALEAIILTALRPSLYVREDKILDKLDGVSDFVREVLRNVDLHHEDEAILEENRAILETATLSAGRLDLRNGYRKYVGTGWLVDEEIVVTNRHVALLFAQRDLLEPWTFQPGRFGDDVEVELNTLAQLDMKGRRSTSVLDVLWIAEPHEPDMALLKVAPGAGAAPLTLRTTPLAKDTPVAVIGYPAEDPRDNDPSLIAKFFGEEFEVKRFAPGRVMDRGDGIRALTYDASTLGGNSGSVVVDLASGEAVGLHFQGQTNEMNTAVPCNLVAAALRQIKTQIAVPSLRLAEGEAEAPVSAAECFEERAGYDPMFLGVEVPLPETGDYALAPLKSDAGRHELTYTHFSVLQSADRRLPLVTAVNIDGNKLGHIPRTGEWRLDGRLAEAHQIGNELYRSNALDRGHMVRRLDPCWGEAGDDDAILAAQADTFHYTNAVPQHENLNQRDWLGLEDYILDSARGFGFRVSVFTGPVFREDDRPLRNQTGAEGVRIPREFWKVAVMVDTNTGALSATGYVLSHGRMIANLTEAEFVLGAYETYQVPLALIERESGIGFGALKKHDPLGVAEASEAAFGHQVRPVKGPHSLVLRPGDAQ